MNAPERGPTELGRSNVPACPAFGPTGTRTLPPPARRALRPGSATPAEQLDDALSGERRRAVALVSDHLLVGDERVEHRLLGGLHHRLEQRVHGAPGHELER